MFFIKGFGMSTLQIVIVFCWVCVAFASINYFRKKENRNRQTTISIIIADLAMTFMVIAALLYK